MHASSLCGPEGLHLMLFLRRLLLQANAIADFDTSQCGGFVERCDAVQWICQVGQYSGVVGKAPIVVGDNPASLYGSIACTGSRAAQVVQDYPCQPTQTAFLKGAPAALLLIENFASFYATWVVDHCSDPAPEIST